MTYPTQRRPNRLDAELDALVAREVDALALARDRPANGRTARNHTKPDLQREDGAESSVPASRRSDSAGSGTQQGDNVIGIRHGTARDRRGDVPFSAEEEAFIERAVAFLSERPNADLLMEEIWSHAVLDRDQDSGLESQEPAAQAAIADEPIADTVIGDGFETGELSSDEPATPVADGSHSAPQPAAAPHPATAPQPVRDDASASDGQGRSSAAPPVPLRSGKRPVTGKHGSPR